MKGCGELGIWGFQGHSVPCVFRRQHLQSYTAPANRHTQHHCPRLQSCPVLGRGLWRGLFAKKRAKRGFSCPPTQMSVGLCRSSQCSCISQIWVQLQHQSSAPDSPRHSVPLSQHPACMGWKAAQGLEHVPSSFKFQEPTCYLHQCCSGPMLQAKLPAPLHVYFFKAEECQLEKRQEMNSSGKLKHHPFGVGGSPSKRADPGKKETLPQLQAGNPRDACGPAEPRKKYP